jgi:hypothetical protein
MDYHNDSLMQDSLMMNDLDEKYSVNDVVMISKPVKRSNIEALSILQYYESKLNKSIKITATKNSEEIIRKTSKDIKIMQY